jgi:predicted dehydrogenase
VEQGQLKIGVMGAADIAVSTIIPNLGKSGRVSVQAIASRDEEKAQKWAKELGIHQYFGSYEEMLQKGDVDAVYIPLVNSLHAEWSIRSLSMGKHVLCEKPLALNSADATRMLHAARKNNLVLMEGFMYRYHPRNLAVFDMVARGEVGTLKAIESSFSYALDDDSSYLMNRDLGGGALYDIGCYPVNVSRLLTRTEPYEVYGTANVASTGVDMTLQSIMRFPGGVISSIHAAMDEEAQFWYRVIGDRGIIEVPWAFVSFGKETKIFVQKDEKQETKSFKGCDEYRLEFEHFADMIEGKVEPIYAIEDSVKNLAVMEALFKSVQRGKPVKLKKRHSG